MIKSLSSKIAINRYLIVAYLLLSFLFFTLMSHYTKTILKKIEYSADNGYIKYDSVYSIDTEFVLRFHDDKEMVNFLKSEFESFTLIKREGNIYGVYVYNDDWQIPLSKGRIFTIEEMESEKRYLISNNDNNGKIVGKPLNVENRSYVNLFSLDRKMLTSNSNVLYGNYLINQNVNNYEYYQNNNMFEDTTSEKRYNNLFLLFFLAGIVQLFITIYSTQKNKISVLKLCGKSNNEILSEYYISGLIVFLLSNITGLIIYILKYPQFLKMKLFLNEFIYYTATTFLVSIPVLIIVFIVVTIYVIKAKPIDLLRRMEE